MDYAAQQEQNVACAQSKPPHHPCWTKPRGSALWNVNPVSLAIALTRYPACLSIVTLMTEGARLFERRPAAKGQPTTRTESELYEQIGRLKMELEWLKKKAAGFS